MIHLTIKQRAIMIECLRRILTFADSDYNRDMVFLDYKSYAKPAVRAKLIKPTSIEKDRALNWYKLTDKGKKVIKYWMDKGYTILSDDLFEPVRDIKGNVPSAIIEIDD